jgi:hypothetical protein
MRDSIVAVINRNPTLTAEQKKQALAQTEKRLPVMIAETNAIFADPSLVDEILAESIPLYASTYTVDEIRQLGAFYQSPVGQKMLANMPKLMAESMAISQRVMMPRIEKVMARMAKDLEPK